MALKMVYYILKQSPFLDIVHLFKLKYKVSEAGSAFFFCCGKGAHPVGHLERTILVFP